MVGNQDSGRRNMETAEQHEKKAKMAFYEADCLFDIECFDGAVSRATAGVLQTAKSIMALIPTDRDPKDIGGCIRLMTKDGRLDEGAMSAFITILKIRAETDESSLEMTKERAELAISAARRVAHILESSAAITQSMRRPEVRAAMIARGMSVPMR
jgi:uncharacterized protein (UPF0332 family)